MPEILDGFRRKKEYLICIDSDGCAMDTMEVKHIKCFGPCLVAEWGLEECSEAVLARWNCVNLYSQTRGINRYKGLLLALEQVDADYKRVAELDSLRAWVNTATELSDANLRLELTGSGSGILKKALHWSQQVNQKISELPEAEKRSFPGVKQALRAAHEWADIAIVSSANRQAVSEEWKRLGLLALTDITMAQDVGPKAHCIRVLLKAGYDRKSVLMIGDAPGDQQAALTNGVLYYPILARREAWSWERFEGEALGRFLAHQYEGDYQEQLFKEFSSAFAHKTRTK